MKDKGCLIYVYLLTVAMTFQNCQSCPGNEDLGSFEFYPSLDKLLVYNEFETLKFVSESGDELVFEKYFEAHKEVRYSDTKKVTRCESDESVVVPYFADIEFSEYFYATSKQDTLKIYYKPRIAAELDMYYWHTYYKNVDFFSHDFEVFDQSRAQWEEESSIELFKNRLDTLFSLQGHSFSGVYYWQNSPNEKKYLFFNDRYGLVGFRVFGELWIRVRT